MEVFIIGDERVYSEDEIKKYLSDKLHIGFMENGWIRRKYKTSGWKGTLMVINTVGHLAEVAWHHPDLAASYGFVIVKLQNLRQKVLQDKDLFSWQRKLNLLSNGSHLMSKTLSRVHRMILDSNTSNMID